MKPLRSILYLFSAAPLMTCSPARAAPLGPGISYQGQLKQNGSPVHGVVDFEFSLYDDPVAGNIIGVTQTVPDVNVVNGLFAVTLNAGGEFGPDAFKGEERWLNVNVNGFDLLPRQALSSVPYARHADRTRGILVDSDGKAGIRTTNPQSSLEVGGGIRARGGPPGGFGFLDNGYAFSGDGGDSDSGMFSSGDGQLEFYTDSMERIRIDSAGSVGIGTSTPASKLDVRGDIKLGVNGELFAAGGDEKLRIVSGVVSSGGVVFAGSGFTVEHVGQGVYTINFTTAFTALPAVTASQAVSGSPRILAIDLINWSSVRVSVYNTSGTLTDTPFCFLAIGSR